MIPLSVVIHPKLHKKKKNLKINVAKSNLSLVEGHVQTAGRKSMLFKFHQSSNIDNAFKTKCGSTIMKSPAKKSIADSNDQVKSMCKYRGSQN